MRDDFSDHVHGGVPEQPASKALVPIGAGTAAVALLVVSVLITKAFGDVLIDLMLMAIAFGLGWWKRGRLQ